MSELTTPQQRMLTMAQRSKRGFTYVGRGQASTAKALEQMGYGRYWSNGYEARFYLEGVDAE